MDYPVILIIIYILFMAGSEIYLRYRESKLPPPEILKEYHAIRDEIRSVTTYPNLLTTTCTIINFKQKYKDHPNVEDLVTKLLSIRHDQYKIFKLKQHA